MLQRIGFILLLSMILVSAACAESGSPCWLTAGPEDRVALLSQPAADAELLGVYFAGVQAEALESYGTGWSMIRVGAQTGYVRTDSLTWDEVVAANAQPLPMGQVVVNVDILRRTPSAEAGRAGLLNRDDTLEILGETAEEWYYARKGGAAGYVSKASLTVAESALDMAIADVPEVITERAAYLTGEPGLMIALWNAPSAQAAVVGEYVPGMNVAALTDDQSGCTLVRAGAQEGYVHSDSLTETAPDSLQLITGTIITETYCNLKQEPDSRAMPAFFAVPGEVFSILGHTANGWYYVDGGPGFLGYIEESAFQPSEPIRGPLEDDQQAAAPADADMPVPEATENPEPVAEPAAAAPTASPTAARRGALFPAATAAPAGGKEARSSGGAQRLRLNLEHVNAVIQPVSGTAVAWEGEQLAAWWQADGRVAELSLTGAAEEPASVRIEIPMTGFSAGVQLVTDGCEVNVTGSLDGHLSLRCASSRVSVPLGGGLSLCLRDTECTVELPMPLKACVVAVAEGAVHAGTLSLPAALPAYAGGAYDEELGEGGSVVAVAELTGGELSFR